MIKLIMIAFSLMFSSVTFGQKIIKGKPLPPVKDTVFIGVSNLLHLEKPFLNPLSVESASGRVIIAGKDLIIHPVSPGKMEIFINYKDTIIKRTFVSTYLPKPTE